MQCPLPALHSGSVLVPHPLEELMDITLTEAQGNQFVAVMRYISPAHPQSSLKCIISFRQKKPKKPNQNPKHSSEWLKALSLMCLFSIQPIPVS